MCMFEEQLNKFTSPLLAFLYPNSKKPNVWEKAEHIYVLVSYVWPWWVSLTD